MKILVFELDSLNEEEKPQKEALYRRIKSEK
jgi:hypothetical protein